MSILFRLRAAVTWIVAAIFLIFFLPYFAVSTDAKLYLLAFGAALLIFLFLLETAVSRKITLHKLSLFLPLCLFALAVLLSTIFTSSNKLDALFTVPTGIVIVFSSFVLYYNLSSLLTFSPLILVLPGVLISALFIILRVFGIGTLVQDPFFTPLGNIYAGVAVISFFVLYAVVELFSIKRITKHIVKMSIYFLSLCVLVFSLSVMIYFLAQPRLKNAPLKALPKAPFYASWQTAIETLKKPKTAVFGAGISNYIQMFTLSKTADYNRLALWDSNFTQGGSFALHILTETGLLGGVSLIIFFIYAFTMVRQRRMKQHRIYLTYMVIAFIFAPPSLPLMFLLMVLAADIERAANRREEARFSLHTFFVTYLIFFAVLTILLASGVYFVGKHALADFYFKKSLDELSQKGGGKTYEYARTSVVLSPFTEQYRLHFSTLNFAAAEALARTKENLEERERKQVTELIEIAINEAKAAVSLRPFNASYWEYLASLYQKLIPVAGGADAWAVAAYQRAIMADPMNPRLRLGAGGVLYGVKKYEEAITFFEQAVGLKPDWVNGYYNLAWAQYQSGKYEAAYKNLQNALYLLPPMSADFEKAKKELAEFEQKVPKENKETAPSTELQKRQESQLELPPEPTPLISPLELPQEASPEATP